MNRLLDRRWLYNVLPLALVGIVTIMAIFGDHGLVRRHELKVREAEVRERIGKLQAENDALRRQIAGLEPGGVGMRRLAAESLLLAPPGSTIYRFPSE